MWSSATATAVTPVRINPSTARRQASGSGFKAASLSLRTWRKKTSGPRTAGDVALKIKRHTSPDGAEQARHLERNTCRQPNPVNIISQSGVSNDGQLFSRLSAAETQLQRRRFEDEIAQLTVKPCSRTVLPSTLALLDRFLRCSTGGRLL